MTDKLTDKQKVLAVWPDAIFWPVSNKATMGAIFASMQSRLKLSEYTTEQKAWADAARLIETQNTFVSCVKNGTAKIEDVNDWIDKWSESKDSRSLHAYLGMTEEQYKKWVDDDSYLLKIIEQQNTKQ